MKVNNLTLGFLIAVGIIVYTISADAQIVIDPNQLPGSLEPSGFVQCVDIDRRGLYIPNIEGFDLIYNEERGCLIPAPNVILRPVEPPPLP